MIRLKFKGTWARAEAAHVIAGSVVEMEDEDLATQLILDGIAVNADEIVEGGSEVANRLPPERAALRRGPFDRPHPRAAAIAAADNQQPPADDPPPADPPPA